MASRTDLSESLSAVCLSRQPEVKRVRRCFSSSEFRGATEKQRLSGGAVYHALCRNSQRASPLRSVDTQVEISDLPVKSEPIIEDAETTQAQCE